MPVFCQALFLPLDANLHYLECILWGTGAIGGS
jgi:hypothetical protein